MKKRKNGYLAIHLSINKLSALNGFVTFVYCLVYFQLTLDAIWNHLFSRTLSSLSWITTQATLIAFHFKRHSYNLNWLDVARWIAIKNCFTVFSQRELFFCHTSENVSTHLTHLLDNSMQRSFRYWRILKWTQERKECIRRIAGSCFYSDKVRVKLSFQFKLSSRHHKDHEQWFLHVYGKLPIRLNLIDLVTSNPSVKQKQQQQQST